MENISLYIKYANNQPVKVQTHVDTLRKIRDFPLTDVGDLIAAFKIAVAPLLDLSSIAQLTLHLPEGVDRSALSEDYFSRVDSKDTTLDPGTLLSTFGSLGLNSKKPLIIESGNDAGQGVVNSLIVTNLSDSRYGANDSLKRNFDDLVERLTALSEGMKPVNKNLLEIREAFIQSKSASISGVGDGTLNQILAFFQLKRTTAEMDFHDFAFDRSDVYQWRIDEFGNLENENSDTNRKGYLSFLAGLLFPEGLGRFSIHDVDKLKGLTLYSASKCFKGDGDVVISKKSCRSDAYFNGILNFELKKTVGLCAQNRPQAIIQLLAFDDLSIYKPVIVVLSDLNDYWELFWIEKPNIVRNQRLCRNEALGYLKWHLGKFEEIIRRDAFMVGSSNTSDNEDDGKAGNKRTRLSTFPAYKAAKYSELTIKGKQRETFSDVGQLNDFPEVTEEEKSRRAFNRMIMGYVCKMDVVDANVVSLIREDTQSTMINYNLKRWKSDEVSDFESSDFVDAIPQETLDIFDLS